MTHIEQILGPWVHDNANGHWFTSKNKNSFVRYYDTGFREICHKRDEGWVISIGHDSIDRFQVGLDHFPSAQAAKKWADNRSDEELWVIELMVSDWTQNGTRLKSIDTPMVPADDPGF